MLQKVLIVHHDCLASAGGRFLQIFQFIPCTMVGLFVVGGGEVVLKQLPYERGHWQQSLGVGTSRVAYSLY